MERYRDEEAGSERWETMRDCGEVRNRGMYKCWDGFCGCEDCIKCHPENFDENNNFILDEEF